VPDVVIISKTPFFHNELGVIKHEGTENEESKVKVNIKEHGRSKEDVGQGQDHYPRQHRHQGASKEEEGAVVVFECSNSEADKDH